MLMCFLSKIMDLVAVKSMDEKSNDDASSIADGTGSARPTLSKTR
jgi:hypothetical protein